MPNFNYTKEFNNSFNEFIKNVYYTFKDVPYIMRYFKKYIHKIKEIFWIHAEYAQEYNDNIDCVDSSPIELSFPEYLNNVVSVKHASLHALHFICSLGTTLSTQIDAYGSADTFMFTFNYYKKFYMNDEYYGFCFSNTNLSVELLLMYFPEDKLNMEYLTDRVTKDEYIKYKYLNWDYNTMFLKNSNVPLIEYIDLIDIEQIFVSVIKDCINENLMYGTRSNIDYEFINVGKIVCDNTILNVIDIANKHGVKLYTCELSANKNVTRDFIKEHMNLLTWNINVIEARENINYVKEYKYFSSINYWGDYCKDDTPAVEMLHDLIDEIESETDYYLSEYYKKELANKIKHSIINNEKYHEIIYNPDRLRWRLSIQEIEEIEKSFGRAF